jgi:hypothetical protein
MRRAFLNVEGALASELCGTHRFPTEETVRSALVKGLVVAEPGQSHRVRTETAAAWGGGNCANATHAPRAAGGRGIQHDVSIDADLNDLNDSGLVCEVKWLKSVNTAKIATDIWKLALSRSTATEGQALRTYLLVGGDPKSVSGVLNSLSEHHFTLRRRSYGGAPPAPTHCALQTALNLGVTLLPHKALVELLSWKNEKTGKHCRMPPACLSRMRLTARASWTTDAPKVPHWRAVLWEMDGRGIDRTLTVNWAPWIASLALTCS